MPKAKKTIRERMELGARKIRSLTDAARGKTKKTAPAQPVVKIDIPASTRDIKDILAERVKPLPGNVGLEISDATPIEESLRILDWTNTLSAHVGFMIGDVLNFGTKKWGDKYHAALNQTGRAYSTLAGYAEASRKIPASKRVPALSFTHHREILRVKDDAKIAEVLKEVGAAAEKGNAPTTAEIRAKVNLLKPKKARKAARVTSGKGKKKKAKIVKPYEPTAPEQAALDSLLDALKEAEEALKDNTKTVLKKCDNATKKRYLALLKRFADFHTELDKVTGY